MTKKQMEQKAEAEANNLVKKVLRDLWENGLSAYEVQKPIFMAELSLYVKKEQDYKTTIVNILAKHPLKVITF